MINQLKNKLGGGWVLNSNKTIETIKTFIPLKFPYGKLSENKVFFGLFVFYT